MATILRIDHDGDLPNSYAQAFRVKLLFANFSQTHHQHIVFNAIGSNAVRSFVETLFLANPIHYVSGSGHGTYDTFLGQDGGIILAKHI